MEEKEKELIKLLQEHEMVCIVGFAGMGKTTLADLVYQAIGDEFQSRAFVSVHLNPNMIEILGTILSQARDGAIMSAGSASEPASEQHTINDISSFLSDKRYLVIIDDIWHWEEWEIIRKALPKNHLGCKIIMTTRIKTIADKCQIEQGAHVYTHIFGCPDARRLSDMRLNTSVVGEVLQANAEGLSAKIVDICGAMPLAVICMSSAWAECHLQGDYGGWDTWVSHLLDGFLSTPSLKPLVQSLCLGFDDLPVHLRTCLLYCSIYPRKHLIERGSLVTKWIAEGFAWQEEVAEAFFDKLVSRNLLQPVPLWSSIYTVHPIMLAFLVCKAKEDNFVACRQYNSPGSSLHAKKIRRVSLQKDRYLHEDLSRTRSLAVLGPQLELHGVRFNVFKKLRVLEIDSCEGIENGHLVAICGLIWLRYLGLKGAPIAELPREIGRLHHLEILIVSDTPEIRKVPKEIEKLQHLETLMLIRTIITGIPKEIEKLQHLRTLNLSGTLVSELPKEIEKLQHLRYLNMSSTLITELPREIRGLVRLESLDVSDTRVRELPKEIGRLQHLRTLDIRMTGVRELSWEVPSTTKVRERSWEVPNSLSVMVGSIDSPQVLKLSLGARSSGRDIIPSSGSCCWEEIHVMLFDHIGLSCKSLPVPMLRVAGMNTSVPEWVIGCSVSSLDIRLCKLGDADLEFLQKMPNLQFLALRLEVLPREPMVIIGGGFTKLEALYVDCRLPLVTFQRRAMPVLKHLEFKFYTGPASQDYNSMGITHLHSLEKVVFRCCEYYTSDSPGIRAIIDLVRKEATEHPNEITLWVNDKDPEVFGSGAEWILQKKIEEREQRMLRYRAAERRAEQYRKNSARGGIRS
ncbi:unnamed protein product [Urochloa humidicola]